MPTQTWKVGELTSSRWFAWITIEYAHHDALKVTASKQSAGINKPTLMCRKEHFGVHPSFSRHPRAPPVVELTSLGEGWFLLCATLMVDVPALIGFVARPLRISSCGQVVQSPGTIFAPVPTPGCHDLEEVYGERDSRFSDRAGEGCGFLGQRRQ